MCEKFVKASNKEVVWKVLQEHILFVKTIGDWQHIKKKQLEYFHWFYVNNT